MARDWLWELEARGIAWRLRGIGSDLVIVPTNRVQELSPSSAASTLQRLVAKQPDLAAEAMRVGAELRGKNQADAHPPRAGGASVRDLEKGRNDVQDALSAIQEALSRGDLVALQVRYPELITEAEIQMLEELRRKRSIPAPPLPPPSPPVEESLHEYSIRVVDDTNRPVAGVRLKLEIEGTPRMTTTDASGVASVQWFSRAPASVRILDQSTLEQNLEESWTQPRSPTLPTGPNVHSLQIGSRFGEVRAPADDETTLVISRPGTCVLIELVDENDEPMAGLRYQLTCKDGTQRSGTLDSKGCAREEGLPPLSWTVDFPELHSNEWEPV